MNRQMGKVSLEKNKKSVNFHTFGPPPKKCETSEFFFSHINWNIFWEFVFSLINLENLQKITRFFPNLSKKFWLSGKGVPSPPPY